MVGSSTIVNLSEKTFLSILSLRQDSLFLIFSANNIPPKELTKRLITLLSIRTEYFAVSIFSLSAIINNFLITSSAICLKFMSPFEVEIILSSKEVNSPSFSVKVSTIKVHV